MAPMMNYIHTDASNVYFLVEWIPLGTPLGLFVGLTLTGVICATERILTKALDNASLELYQLQEDRLLELQERTAAAAAFSSTTNGSAADSTRRRVRTNSSNGKQSPQHDDATPASPLPSASGSGNSSSNSGSGAGGLIHGSTSLTRLHLLQRRQMRRIVAKKTLLYFCVNALRLGYMLLAMSLHLGLLIVIEALEGYDPIGSSMELDHDFSRPSLRNVDQSDEDEDEDTDTSETLRQQRQHSRGSRLQQQRRPQNSASMALHLSRSHECA
ncbi:hypothetical protein DFQ27_002210 [Actinomortierella ambigua]|uniref:Copper transporter n=1 Tax=Actinomortierella ambigua TaxID=1343610 RepID=A0A9P6Q820_9FUNG|nr:hypothetical protein DFQ27_002210 [Actinomortierella ambigua]